MFEGFGHTFLASLAKQLEVNDARLLLRVELDPEVHSALHRRPSVTAELHTDYGRHLLHGGQRIDCIHHKLKYLIA